MCDSSMADSASFSSLLKSVLTTNSPTVRFQGPYETPKEDIMVRTKPRMSKSQLKDQAECANPPPAAASVSHLAPAIPEPMLTQNVDPNTSRPNVDMEITADDGYSWRKYGQKQVKSSKSSRSYYRCSRSNCYAKKKVQRSDHSGQIIDTVYIGQHNHDLPQNKCNMSREFASSAKLTASSHIVDSKQKVDGACMSSCSENTRQSLLHMAESEQQSSSSSIGKGGIKVHEQNGNELESKKFYYSSEVGHQKKNSCEIANAEVQEKHGTEPAPKEWMRESTLKADKDSKVVVHATADGPMSSDGFRWRKYGQKIVKGNSHLRSYYRCTSAGCPSRKHVETATDDATHTIITYEGRHDHDMPVPKKQKISKELAYIFPNANRNHAHCKKIDRLSSQSISRSTKQSVDREGDIMDEKVLELGGETALESAQTLLSIGIQCRPC